MTPGARESVRVTDEATGNLRKSLKATRLLSVTGEVRRRLRCPGLPRACNYEVMMYQLLFVDPQAMVITLSLI